MKQLFPDPPRPELKTETVAGHTLQYAELDRAGSPRILFIHGSPGEWHAFASYLNRPELQVCGPVLAPDRPGYGGSETQDRQGVSAGKHVSVRVDAGGRRII